MKIWYCFVKLADREIIQKSLKFPERNRALVKVLIALGQLKTDRILNKIVHTPAVAIAVCKIRLVIPRFDKA